ncbi:hypothetical protein FB45DRAFT_891336 [Roridomyces roridus]|uniref:Uncharacterized protein n=1 Tax=Roridomyces roridus TaxID=1738132 RepID=A0AAD7FYN0_9AGAR|nr:hypothetical protein FB45DRAFT_891336 [Roridomyces roridus]
MRIIMESGALYCICVIILAATAPIASSAAVLVVSITIAISTQAVNIIPTLALVLGTREENSNQDLQAIEATRPKFTAPRKAAVKVGPASNAPQILSQMIYIGKTAESI